MEDISDLYIKSDLDPGYKENQLENQTWIETVVAKLYMILLTNKGDVYGDNNFGADIPKYLWKTRFPASAIQQNIVEQIETYVPELSIQDYKVEVFILPGDFQDIGIVNIDLFVTGVNVLFK
jgi:hypothetical protein